MRVDDSSYAAGRPINGSRKGEREDATSTGQVLVRSPLRWDAIALEPQRRGEQEQEWIMSYDGVWTGRLAIGMGLRILG